MEEILNIILANLCMVGIFLIPMVLARFADICMGLVIAKKTSIAFDWKKLLWGIWFSFCFVLGLGSLVTAVSMIIPLVTMYGITLDETLTASLNNINGLAICLLIITVTIKSYGTDAFAKFKTLLGK